VNSKWVQHELNVALALQLEGKPVDVIPLLLDSVERPPAVSDLKSIDLRPHNFDKGLRELVMRLRGLQADSRSAVDLFRDYANTAVVVDNDWYESVQGRMSLAKIDSLAQDGVSAPTWRRTMQSNACLSPTSSRLGTHSRRSYAVSRFLKRQSCKCCIISTMGSCCRSSAVRTKRPCSSGCVEQTTSASNCRRRSGASSWPPRYARRNA